MVEGKVVLPGKYCAAFLEVVSQTTGPGVISFDGRNFVVSNFTFQFPGEEVWKRDLAKKAERERAELEESLKKLPPEKEKEMRKALGL